MSKQITLISQLPYLAAAWLTYPLQTMANSDVSAAEPTLYHLQVLGGSVVQGLIGLAAITVALPAIALCIVSCVLLLGKVAVVVLISAKQIKAASPGERKAPIFVGLAIFVVFPLYVAAFIFAIQPVVNRWPEGIIVSLFFVGTAIYITAVLLGVRHVSPQAPKK